MCVCGESEKCVWKFKYLFVCKGIIYMCTSIKPILIDFKNVCRFSVIADDVCELFVNTNIFVYVALLVLNTVVGLFCFVFVFLLFFLV